MDGISKQRRGNRYGRAAVDFLEYVGKWEAPGIVGEQFEGKGYHVAAQEYAQHLGVALVGVHEGKQQRPAFYHARVGGVEGREIDDDVGCKGGGALGDFDTATGIGIVAVVYVLGGAALHLHPEAACHEHAGTLGSEGEAVVEHAARGRQADDSLACDRGGF